jgi:hypothetical protein
LTASKLFDTSAARHLFEKEMTRLNRCDFPFDGAVACIDLTCCCHSRFENGFVVGGQLVSIAFCIEASPR